MYDYTVSRRWKRKADEERVSIKGLFNKHLLLFIPVWTKKLTKRDSRLPKVISQKCFTSVVIKTNLDWEQKKFLEKFENSTKSFTVLIIMRTVVSLWLWKDQKICPNFAEFYQRSAVFSNSKDYRSCGRRICFYLGQRLNAFRIFLENLLFVLCR